MKINKAWTAIFVVLLSGCAGSSAPAVPYAIGGSRSDASVEVAYDFGIGAKAPTLQSLNALARKKCAAWGYDSAEAFGGQNKNCNGKYCLSGKVVIQYQCLGNPN